MNKWKIGFFSTFAIAILSSGYLFYLLFDSAISYHYLEDSYNHESRRFNTLGRLVVAGSADYSKADFLHLLRQSDKDAFIVEEDNHIQVEAVRFIFDDDRLTSVE